MNDPRAAGRAVRTSSVLHDRTGYARLEVSGPDRARFLHNLTTNDVKRLPAGRGMEAFVTSPQGKTIGYVTLLAADDRILVRTDPGGFVLALPHLRKYGVFDDVAIDETGPGTFEYHLAGPEAEILLKAAGAQPPEEGDLRHRATEAGGRPVRVVRESPLGFTGLTVLGARADAETVLRALDGTGRPPLRLDPDSADALRVAAGTPAFGRDVTADNLPQEVARDARAINFVKGCYLGQETVARIDALGHVNKLLRGLVLDGTETVPPAGSALQAGGKTVGTITSAALSPATGKPIALAYLRTAQAAAGTEVRVGAGEDGPVGLVTDLPIAP